MVLARGHPSVTFRRGQPGAVTRLCPDVGMVPGQISDSGVQHGVASGAPGQRANKGVWAVKT